MLDSMKNTMQQNILHVFGICVITLVISLMFWASPSQARQDQTPTPAPDITLVPSDTSTVAALPFADTFDTNWGWASTGSWTYDPAIGYEGGGWRLDGTQRETVSTLTYNAGIDLSGTLSAQLIFRQQGILPTSDFIAVDVSLDGGQTWNMVDQQIGITTEWELRGVDLTNYRGQVVRLRFRISTGTQLTNTELATTEPTDPIAGFFGLDNVAIQYVDIAPELVFMPEPLGPRTLMGLHLTVGAPHEAVVDLAKRLEAIGWPLGTLKGTTGTASIVNEVARISPDTVIVYRALNTPWGMRDCPDTSHDPVLEAQRWIAGFQAEWATVQADYYEIMNECLPPMEWLVPFTIEAMRQAGARGQCVLVFSFSAGNPEPDVYAQLLPVYEDALEHPCQPGRYHGIALHAYGIDRTTLVSESGLGLGLRHRLFYAEILPDLPEAIRIPVYLTEAGAGDGRADFACEDVVRDVLQYTSQLEFDPYVRGFHLWNVGSQGQWVDFARCLPQLGDALTAYYGQN